MSTFNLVISSLWTVFCLFNSALNSAFTFANDSPIFLSNSTVLCFASSSLFFISDYFFPVISANNFSSLVFIFDSS
jgi:hypothetical protein